MEPRDAVPNAEGRAAGLLPERGVLGGRVLFGVFVLVALVPVVIRLRHPTLLGDDVTRVVNLIHHPLRELAFRPFSEHVAPSFELVSWSTWQVIGHDLRRAPLGFSLASILPWILLVPVFGLWLRHMVASRTATLVAVAVVAQSPLVLEAMWWYSASSFTWALLGVLLAVYGVCLLRSQPRRGAALIATGSALGPSFSTVGLLALPLVAVQNLFDARLPRRRKVMGVLAAGLGLAAYLLVCQLAGSGTLRTIQTHKRGTIDPVAGLGYAVSVPGRVLWPAVFGVPPSWTVHACPAWLAGGLGILVLGITVVLMVRRGALWNRHPVVVGAAMIYLCYLMTYSSRVCMVRQGLWTEPQMLYEFAGRYHVLPLMGLAAILAAVLASLAVVRRCDASPVRSISVGILAGLLAMVVNRPEQKASWNWMLEQPDQKATLTALHRLGEAARAEGVSREQLTRVFDAVVRPWNSCLRDQWCFPLTRMVVQTPDASTVTLPDDVARARLLARLKPVDRFMLESGACVSMSPAHPGVGARTVTTARLVESNRASQEKPGRYRWERWPFYLEYEVDVPTGARFLELPGLTSEHDLQIYWSDDAGRWRELQYVYWLHDPAPKGPPVIDVERLGSWPAGRRARFRVQLTCPGELTLQGEPRLLR